MERPHLNPETTDELIRRVVAQAVQAALASPYRDAVLAGLEDAGQTEMVTVEVSEDGASAGAKTVVSGLAVLATVGVLIYVLLRGLSEDD